MKKMTALLVVLVLCLSLAACGEDKPSYDEALQGRWEYCPDYTTVPVCTRYEFEDGKVVRTHIRDGEVFGDVHTGTYQIDGTQVEILFDDPQQLSISFNCKMEGDTLVLEKLSGSAAEGEAYHKVG